MKLRFKLLSLLAAVALMPACGEKNEPIADIIVSVEPSTVELTSAAADQNVSITATRAWKATVVYEGDDTNWLSVSPESGAASTEKQPMTITVKENTGRDRQAKVKISIGLDDAFLTVKQAGPGGSADPVFFNNFDKKATVKDGDGHYPYVSDCADSWQNETGTGISTLSYVLDNNKATIRSNANSPTPAASGANNWFFGANAYFCVKDITLPSVSNFTVSFFGNRAVYGKEKGSGESVFDHDIFKVYISADNHKWVSLDYKFEGGDPDADWGQASSTFTLPSGTAKLSIYIPALTETSTYRLDDIKLDVASQAGTAIDFSQGVEMEIGGGGDKPGTPTGTGVESDPYNPTAAINKAKEIGTTASTEYYFIKGFVSSIKEIDTGQYGNATFYITDTKAYDTTPLYCYRCKYIGGAKFTSEDQLKVGDEVVVKAKLLNYKGDTPETSDASLVSINGGGGGEEIETEKVAEVIAATEGSKVTLKNALVVASAKEGYLVTDAEGKDFIYVYDKGATSVPAVGDKGNVKATKSSYSSMPQLNSPQFTTVSSGTEVTYPDPEDITSGFDSFTSTKVKYISYTGKLSISGAYYNIEVPGATKNIGALVAPAIDMTPYVGVDGLTYEGYYLYTSSGKYVYIIFTKVGGTIKPFFRLSAESAKVSAAATSAKFSVSASDAIDWSIAAPAGVTATPASGTGSKEITVTFPANETESEVNYSVKVSTTSADIEIKELTFNIKQAGKSAPGEGIVLSKETINTSGWTVNSYGSQATATASSYLNWTVEGVSFTGCRLCLPNTSGDYSKVNAIQCQGDASVETKQARFGNTTSLGVIKRITVVSYNSANNTPNFNLALGTAQVVGTSIPTGMINAASMVTDKEAAGDVTKFTTVYDVEGAYDYFAIYNNTVGALYWSEVIIETGDGPVKPTFKLSATSANVGAATTSTTFGVVASGDVSWTVTAPEGVTATPASGTGNQTVTLSFPANETESEVNYSVKVSTTSADVDTKELTFALKQAAKVPVGAGLVLSKETINTSGWTVGNYGSQATDTAGSYLNWTVEGVSFTGCRLCLPAGNGYDTVNAIQCQGHATDAAKQARFGNTSAMGKIRKITVVSYYTAEYSPNFNLALGTSQVVGTAVPEGMIGAASMTTTHEEVGSIVKYTTTYEVTGDNTFFAIYKNTAGALYWSEIIVEAE